MSILKKLVSGAILVVLCVSVFCAIFLTGCCENHEEAEEEPSTFVIVEDSHLRGYRVVYHRKTKVMYTVSCGSNSGIFTVMVDEEGKPLLWEGE